jgi:methylglutaconyl-CoA hydratase
MSGEEPGSVRVERTGPLARVVLARPDVRNAFDDRLIGELTDAFQSLGEDGGVRAVLLSGDGPVFCAGADVRWMRKAGGYSTEENMRDAERMARMLRTIDDCPRPVIATAQGAAIGGGVGLLAACDVVIAAEDCVFSLAEVRLGILPAVVSPYVVRSIGPRFARDLFLTGDRFDARTAYRIGLVHEVAGAAELESAARRRVESILSSGPEAVAAAKRLIAQVVGRSPEEAMALTVRTIAERRASKEAKEGLSAFLEKRRPSWAGKLEP